MDLIARSVSGGLLVGQLSKLRAGFQPALQAG
jgi:hypothetical protein